MALVTPRKQDPVQKTNGNNGTEQVVLVSLLQLTAVRVGPVVQEPAWKIGGRGHLHLDVVDPPKFVDGFHVQNQLLLVQFVDFAERIQDANAVDAQSARHKYRIQQDAPALRSCRWLPKTDLKA